MRYASTAGATIGMGQPANPVTVQSMIAQGMGTNTPFTPGSPITPRRAEGESPIQWAYRIGQNIVQTPRSTEDIDFATIDGIVESYDIAKLCRKVRIDQIRSMDWHIRPNDMKTYRDRLPEIKRAEQLFSKPYSGALFTDFLCEIEHDRLTYDAPCFYKQRTRAGKLGALEPVDGRSITPIIDFYGHPPIPPAPAFIQFVRGFPEVWMTRDALMYRPFYATTASAYGIPPIVNVLMNANTDVRMYLYLLSYFTEGNIPAAFMNMPTDMTDPAKITEYQKLYDELMASEKARQRKIHMIPSGSKVQQAREFSPTTDFTKYMLTITCAAFDVVPSELGFTETTNKSSGDSQENVQMRRSQKPTIKFYNEIFTDILHNELGMPDLKMELVVNNKDEDQLMDAQRHQVLVNIGAESREDAAMAMFGHAPTDGIVSGRTVTLGNEVIPVNQIANGYTGQGQNNGTPASQPPALPTAPAQKAATIQKKNRFQNDAEEALCKKFSNEVIKALVKQATVLSEEAKKFAEKMQKAGAEPSDMFIEVVLSVISQPEWNKDLLPAVKKNIYKIFVSSMADAQGNLGIELPEQTGADGTPLTAEEIFHNAATGYAGARSGELIKGLDDTTRITVKNFLSDAITQSMTPQQIADSLVNNYAFSDTRAMLIARAETADAWNMGSIGIGKAAGHNAVLVFDGTDFDQECQEADGQVWSMGYAQRHLKQHPRCVRSFSSRYADPDEIDLNDDDE